MKPHFAIPLFLLGALAIDRAIGFVLTPVADRVVALQDPSGVAAANWVLANRQADVLIFGSSRAKHHFDPQVLDAKLGVDASNVGIQARGIRFARMVQSELLRKGTRARLFVLQLELAELFDPAPQRAVSLAPWYGRSPVVDDILEDSSQYAWLKLQSHAYRYNGKVLHMLRDSRKPSSSPTKGYVALRGSLNDFPERKGRGALHRRLEQPIPAERGQLYREFVRAAGEQGIEVAFVIGPRLRPDDPEPDSQYAAAVQFFQQLARDEGAHFLPLTDVEYPDFRQPSLYRDWLHLNATGAALLSRRLADALRQRDLPGASR